MNVKKSTAIASAMTGLLALGAQFIAAPVMAADDKEKCYGVVKDEYDRLLPARKRRN